MPTFYNGKHLIDTDGNVVHCHGAGFLRHEGWYYMFGEDRRGDNRVSCYRSRDMVTWEFRNIVLTLNSATASHYVRTEYKLSPKDRGPMGGPGVGPRGANIERPKVLYCENTGKFVMWMHYENGRDYNAAACAVAVCDTIDGDYTYLGSFNPVGNMSRDCTLFKDDDGSAYFISSARDNADMIVYRLSDDYLSVGEQVKILWPGQYREAPVLFKRGELYYMLTSQCTGWSPNQSGVAVSKSVDGRWSSITPLGGCTTFNTQPTAAMNIGGDILYIGDRWDPVDYQNSKIIYLPLSFPSDGDCRLEWADEVELTESGIKASAHDIDEFRIMGSNCTDYVGSDGYNIFTRHLGYADKGLLWTRQDVDGGFMLRHSESGRYMSGDGIMLDYDPSEPRLVWNTAPAGGSTPQPAGGGDFSGSAEPSGRLLINAHSGKSLLVFGRRVILSDRDDKHFGGYKFVKNY